MAQTLKIKRSSTTATPLSLAQGELAYSSNSDKLFVGNPGTGDVTVIGGKLYVDMLDHAAGVLTGSSALVVDADSKLDNLLVDNLQFNGNAITSTNTNGNLALTPNGTGNLVLDGVNWPQADGVSGYVLTTNGSGQTSWAAASSALSIAGDSGTDSVALLSDTLTYSGGTNITTSVTDNNVSIALDDSITLTSVTAALTGNVTGNITSTGTSTFATVDINGGAIDGTVIGANSAAAGSFTTVAASGNATVGGTLGVTGAATLSSTLSAGASTLASASVTGNATVGGTLGVTSETTLSDALTVAGVADFQDAVSVTGDFDVNSNFAVTASNGNTTVGGTLSVTGATTLSSTAAITGNTTVGGTLGVTGALTASSTAAITGNTTVGGTLGVTGAVTASSTVDVAGNFAVNTDKLTVNATTGNVVVGNDLTVGGNTVIAGNLTVQGTTTSVTSTTVQLGDNILELNSGESGAPSANAGLEVNRGTSANVSFLWNETLDKWQITRDGTNFYVLIDTNNFESEITTLDGGTF